MKQLLALFLVLALLLACAAAALMLAFGWFSLRTGGGSTPVLPLPLPPTFAPGVATPTLAALPPAGSDDTPAPIGGGVPGGGATGAGFNGTFSGTLNGDRGSSAIGTLTLTQTGDTVSGDLVIGPGLVLDAGTCGAQSIPQLTQTAGGTIDPAAPNRLRTTSSIPLGGFTIGVVLTAELSADGQTLAARADLDLPFLCGRDPSVSGTLGRN